MQGIYAGTIRNGNAFNLLVLENNDDWAMYGIKSNGQLLVAGLMQGSGAANNGNFSSSDLRDYFFDGTVQSGTLTASYNPGVNFNGSTTVGATTTAFAGIVMTGSLYNYNAPQTWRTLLAHGA